jgi:hypothetical protein
MVIMSRRGMGVLELLMAGVLLGTLMTVSLKFFAATAAQRCEQQQRQVAVQEVANVMERIAARPWKSLTTQGLNEIGLCEEAQARLPAAKLEIEVAAMADEPVAKRIAVSLRWENSGHWVRPVRLVAWRYQGEPAT